MFLSVCECARVCVLGKRLEIKSPLFIIEKNTLFTCLDPQVSFRFACFWQQIFRVYGFEVEFSTLMAQYCACELVKIYKQSYIICVHVCLLLFSLDNSRTYRNLRFLPLNISKED